MDLQEVYRNIILRNDQGYPFNKAWFQKHLGVGFTGFGVQMIYLWIAKLAIYEGIDHYLRSYRKY